MANERLSPEQIKQARQANLAEYLISRGEPLHQEGRRYRHGIHDSLYFTDNAYYWNSRGEHGNAIDFLCSFYGMDFKSAVFELISANLTGHAKDVQPPASFTWSDIEKSRSMERVIAYLHKTRGISYEIIHSLIHQQLLFQEIDSNNIIFPIYDENKRIVGAELSGTLTRKRFKGLKPASKYGYGYNIGFGDNFTFMLFFESAIDLLSFVDLKNAEGRSLDGCILVSMAGLKQNIVEHSLAAFGGDLKPVVCVDNDKPAQEFIQGLKSSIKGLKERLPDSQFKDWNEQLLATLKT